MVWDEGCLDRKGASSIRFTKYLVEYQFKFYFVLLVSFVSLSKHIPVCACVEPRGWCEVSSSVIVHF